MRFQRGKRSARQVAEVTLDPRSGYMLSGAARYVWQHSIPPTKTLRYSITFRTLQAPEPRRLRREASGPPESGGGADPGPTPGDQWHDRLALGGGQPGGRDQVGVQLSHDRPVQRPGLVLDIRRASTGQGGCTRPTGGQVVVELAQLCGRSGRRSPR